MDAEILCTEDVAEILKQDREAVVALFASGALPGREIGGQWYTTRRQLVHFVEGRQATAATVVEQAARAPLAHVPAARRAPNAWTCGGCGAKNDAERVLCRVCRAARETPLIGYIPKH